MNVKKKLQEKEKRDACQECMMFVNASQTPPLAIVIKFCPNHAKVLKFY